MNQKMVWTTVLVVILAAGAITYYFWPVSDDAQVRATVARFGKSMQTVSLAAPPDDVTIAMEKAYKKYVAPDLLSQWESGPLTAPGRITSSPWPDHIVVDTVVARPNGMYAVMGSVVEQTSTGVAGSYPVSLRLAKQGGKWMIIAFVGYPPPAVPGPGPLTVEGTTTCLLHRDISGPQTLECALGIKEDGTGRYFALASSDPSQLGSIPGGTHVHVEGDFTPQDDQKYQDVGVLTVTSVTEL